MFIWLYWVLVATPRIFSCSMWDLVPQPWIELRPPALGALSLSHWTISEVPEKASVVGLYVRWPLGKPWWGQCSLTCHTNQK